STRTDRSERVRRRASRALRGRADLPHVGRVGLRLLRASQRPPLAAGRRGRAVARPDPRAARIELLRLRLPADVEDAPPGRRAGAALPGATADARQRDRWCEAAWQALADDQARPAGGPSPRSRRT